MASVKRIGFFLGDDKITLIEFERNSPVRIIAAPLGLKGGSASAFSSDLTEEIQIIAVLKKMLQDGRIANGVFHVSLPMKEIILRSFVIPFVKTDDLANAIKFEAKRYLPFDIQDLSYVFHTMPISDGTQKQLQVIFFAARKDVLSRYERIFAQVNMPVSHGEPYIVSLTKALLFRKEIRSSEHLAFLTLDQNFGRICFINNGIPQFIREFSVGAAIQSEEEAQPAENITPKIVNEVGNSFEFYSRQFNGEGIKNMLVLSEFVQKDLLEALEAELKLKVSKFSPVINTGAFGQSNDIDAIYAMGACVPPSVDALAQFNFIEDKTTVPSAGEKAFKALKPFKENILALVISLIFLIAIYAFFQLRLQLIQGQYKRLTAKEGAFLIQSQGDIEALLQKSADKLHQYKNVSIRSDLAGLILRLASHVPQGTLLTKLTIDNSLGDTKDAHMTIDIEGVVVVGGANEQIASVRNMFSDFQDDKELAKVISNVSLGSLSRQTYKGKEATGFTIHFS
ncbi:MAG: hypothetical protein KGK03_02900 [Candidatus Omnitrophica bacterium]|nr:hypothetical protein [Candidatus Omnitrophota bacterium]MDE2222000.1 hypothetical protein [Candidatus Omnitrophota bacterium]